MRIVVLGIGNILLSDEGLGVHVVRRLIERFDLPARVEVIDGGTAGMDLLDRVAGADALVIVDCAALGQAPGALREIVGTGVPAFFQTRLSPHQIGLSDLLGAVMLLGEMPARLALIAVEPEGMELDLAMTTTGERTAEVALSHLVARLRDWGAPPVPRTVAAE
jgi:hydrogenase maturation protease